MEIHRGIALVTGMLWMTMAQPADPDWLETRERILVELRGDRDEVPPHLLEPTNLDILLQHVLTLEGETQLPDSRNARRRLADEAAEILSDHTEDLADLTELENTLRPMYPLLGGPSPLMLPGWPAVREAILAELDRDTPDPTTLDADFRALDGLMMRELQRWDRGPEVLATEREQRRSIRAVTRPYETLLTLRQRVQQTAALWPAPSPTPYEPVAEWADLREAVPEAARVLNGDPAYHILEPRVVDALIRERLERHHGGQIPASSTRRRHLLNQLGYRYRSDYLTTPPALARLEQRVRERFANPQIRQYGDGTVVVDLGLVPGAVVPGRADAQGARTEVPIIPVPDPAVFQPGQLLLDYRERFPDAEPLGLVYEFYRGRDEETEGLFHFQQGHRIIRVESARRRGGKRFQVSPELEGLAAVVDADGQLAISEWLRVSPPRRRTQREPGSRWTRPAPPWVYGVLRKLPL